MKAFKISVHIPHYISGNSSNKSKIFTKVCNSYLKISKNIKIFVHTNKKIKKKNSKIKYIYHNLNNINPFKLTWLCRKLMFEQKDKFDIFIYSEDDIIFSKKNFNYWLKYKDICIQNRFNLNFLRVEKSFKNKKLYSTDQIKKIKFYLKIKKILFAKLESSYCALWIYDKQEFANFIKSKYWNFKFNLESISGSQLTREMSAYGWHAPNMDRYNASIIPIINGKLNTNSFIRHISNNYVQNSYSENPTSLFGSNRVDKLLEKKLLYFYPKKKIYKILENLKMLIYKKMRFNLKNYKK